MEFEFEKKGTTYKVEVDETGIYLTVFDIRVPVTLAVMPEWTYKIEDRLDDLLEKFGANKKFNRIYIAHPSAADVHKHQRHYRQQEENAIIAAYKEGRKLFKVRYQEGEYLSGYALFNKIEGKILSSLGLTKDISMWGYHVDNKLIENVGEEFSYTQAFEFARPELEKREKEKEHRIALRQAKFDEAEENGSPVLLSKWTEACNDPREECDLDSVSEYAMPDGSTVIKRYHTW